MAKPKIYTMFVSFSAMDMEQAVEYVSNLDDEGIRSCIEEEGPKDIDKEIVDTLLKNLEKPF